ncbi:MAG: tetratricopeptide repeat protein [Planctomycetes bacterium]|nr:tetratricopeptide repeat protein [Planctomycetota bacterium]
MVSVAETLQEGLSHHQSGRLNEAESIYRNILRIDPEHADSLHLLGVVAHQRGRHEIAVEYFHKAMALSGPAASALNNLGTFLRALGRVHDAVDAFRQAVSIAPAFAGAHFNLAMALEEIGESQQAMTCYENCLAGDSKFLNAYVHLGRLLASQHRFEEAIECFQNALREDCRFLPAQLYLAETLHACGRLEAAADGFRQVLKQHPRNAEARRKFEKACEEIGFDCKGLLADLEDLKKRIDLHSGDVSLHFVYAQKLEELSRYEEAYLEYQQILKLDPAHGESHFRIGNLLFDQGKLEEAAECYRRAAEYLPRNETVHLKHANVLMDLERLNEAIESYRLAVEINPGFVSGWYNLGNALREDEQYSEAETCYRKTLELDPTHDKARFNLGIVLRNQGRLSESLDCWEQILRNAPHNPQANLQQALTLLTRGDYSQGWDEYEWRWKAEVRPRSFEMPVWKGESLENKSILIHAEQGVGDEIMFASCIPELLEQAGECSMECDSRLVSLFERSFPQAQVFSRPINRSGTGQEPSPCFDRQIAMGSLPRFLRRSLDSFPEQKRFLIPDEKRLRKWHERFAELGNGLKVGISWRGGRKPEVRRSRSTTLDQWIPVLRTPGVQFINLQYGECRQELATCQEQHGISIHDWDDADPVADLDDFAAQIAALDLVISIDNATVHMSGALGVPVWTLLPFAPDYRWMTGTDTSPWYPSMTLFRQPKPRDWKTVFDRVVCELELFLHSR